MYIYINILAIADLICYSAGCGNRSPWRVGFVDAEKFSEIYISLH